MTSVSLRLVRWLGIQSMKLSVGWLGFLAIERLASAQPVAAYGFDEGGGIVAGDASGNGNGGTINGATWAVGRFGNALNFNGTGALVTVNDSVSLDLTNAMTLEAWVNPTAVGGWRDVIYKGVDDVYVLEGSSSSGGPAIGSRFIGNSLIGTGALPLNTWTHLAGTYDGANLRLFVNGVQVASRAQTGLIEASSGALTIGGDTLYGQFFAGRIDEVRIYNRALSAAEIQTDMNTAVSVVLPDSTPPTVSIASPIPGTTLSHVVPITAVASDNVGVFSVQFFLDGVSLGSVACAPYTFHWNSTTTSNGSRTLTAIARDPAGNQTTSAAVPVTTLNPAFVNEVAVPGIAAATTMAFLPDGRMLVGELTGTIWVVQPGANQPDPTPFLQVESNQLEGEQGLVDIALDPNFGQNNFLYVFYTRSLDGEPNRDRASRFVVSGNAALSETEFVVWEDDVVASPFHHGGALSFATDGKLFITIGDHFDPPFAQRLDSYHGKLLRLNSDGSVPTDNPFYDGAGPNKDAIWALGLRNPFRMSTDIVTGRMFIADVGGNDPHTAIEEIDLVVRGANYGWPLCEGDCAIIGMTSPTSSYPHLGRDASITGGFVYRGSQFPAEYAGSYFFADYSQNLIRRLTFDAGGNVTAAIPFWPANGSADGATGDPVKLVEGPDGSLYYIDIGFNLAQEPNSAAIRRIRYVIANQPPSAVASGTPLSGSAPLMVDFSSTGSSDPEGAPLTYHWTFGDGASSTEASPTHTYGMDGPYVVRLSVSDGVNTTLSSDLSITVGNPPSATILNPTHGSPFRAGDAIAYSGSATDMEDGVLPPSAFNWTILFHHDTHVHPVGGLAGATNGTLTIPISGHDFLDQTSYEIILSVTDSTGLKSSSSVTVFPEKVDLRFDTVPTGLNLEINGISKQTPFVLDDLVGFHEMIKAPHQTNGSTTYSFVGWSDGGAQSHEIVVPTVNQSYVATFQISQPLTNSYTNAAAITIPGVGNGTPYPSAINVSGMSGMISQVTVTLRSLSHTWPADIDVLLVGPGGQKAMIFSDAGGGGDVNNVTLTLSDAAATALTAGGQIVAGTYRPTNVEPGEQGELDAFGAPAPAGPYTAGLSVFNGTGANGTWSLYVVDDGAGDLGSLAGGWSLTVMTVAPNPPLSINGTVRYYPTNYPPSFPSTKTVGETRINLTGDTNLSTLTLSDGSFDLEGVAGGGTYGTMPSKTNDSSTANGVSSTDLVLIRRHILGTTPLNSPYKLLAGDVNASGAVNSTDLVLIRRLILGTSNSFPAGLWRHVPAGYVFPNANSPWNAPANLWHTNLVTDVVGEDLVAIKLGDVNDSWTMSVGESSLASGSDSVSAASLNPEVLFRAGNQAVRPGETVTVPIAVTDFRDITSAQFTLSWDPAVIRYTGTTDHQLRGLSAGNFGTARTQNGKLAFAWDDPETTGVTVMDEAIIFAVSFEVTGKAGDLTTLTFDDSITLREVGVNVEEAAFQGQSGIINVLDPEHFQVSAAVLQNGGFQLSVPTIEGRGYVLEFTDRLPGTNWMALPAVPGDGTMKALIDPAATNSQRFYRVRVVE